MTWPTDWPTGRITGYFFEISTRLPWAKGQIEFTPVLEGPVTADSPSGSVTAFGEPIRANIDDDGFLDISLAATDADTNPTGWTWRVQELRKQGRTFSITVPAGSTQDYGDLAPVSEAAGIATTRGPRGKSAFEVAVDGGFTGTQAQWLASLVGPPGIQVVTHGTDASTARPAGVPLVYWQGSVTPLNAAATDLWIIP